MDINSFQIKKKKYVTVFVSVLGFSAVLKMYATTCCGTPRSPTQSVTTLACVLGEVCIYLWVMGSVCVVKQIFWRLSLIQKYTCMCFVWVLNMVFSIKQRVCIEDV